MQNNSRKEKINMKLFEMPEVEVVKLAAEDVIATSLDTPPAPAQPSAEDFCV